MKKIFRYLILLASLSLHAAAWGDMADNGVECSVVMEKTQFDARTAFPDFKLVFTNRAKRPCIFSMTSILSRITVRIFP